MNVEGIGGRRALCLIGSKGGVLFSVLLGRSRCVGWVGLVGVWIEGVGTEGRCRVRGDKGVLAGGIWGGYGGDGGRGGVRIGCGEVMGVQLSIVQGVWVVLVVVEVVGATEALLIGIGRGLIVPDAAISSPLLTAAVQGERV